MKIARFGWSRGGRWVWWGFEEGGQAVVGVWMAARDGFGAGCGRRGTGETLRASRDRGGGDGDSETGGGGAR